MIENKEKEGSIRKINYNWKRIENIYKDKNINTSLKIRNRGEKNKMKFTLGKYKLLYWMKQF